VERQEVLQKARDVPGIGVRIDRTVTKGSQEGRIEKNGAPYRRRELNIGVKGKFPAPRSHAKMARHGEDTARRDSTKDALARSSER